MLRPYRALTGFTGILVKSKLLCSTAVKPEKNASQPLLEQLSHEFTDVEHLKNVVEKHNLQNIHFREWKSRIDVLKLYDFTDKECFQMIHKYPQILKIPVDSLKETVEEWFKAGLGFDNFQSVLLTHPALCDVDSVTIDKRLQYLRNFFNTQSTLTMLLKNSPNVMCDNWSHVILKLRYLLMERRFGRHEILESCALSKTMYYIKFRLDLLEKCGIYKQDNTPIHKINKYDKTRHQNPKLKDILLLSAAKFVKIAKISTEEYAVCRDLFMSEGDIYDDDDDAEELDTYNKYDKKKK